MQVFNRLSCARTKRRSLISVFALLAICLVAVHPVSLMASSRTSEAKVKLPTTTKLKASATTVTAGEVLTLTADVLPSKATGKVTAYGAFKATGPWEEIATEPDKNGVAKGSQAIPSDLNENITVYLRSVYNGSKTYASSISNVVKVQIKKKK